MTASSKSAAESKEEYALRTLRRLSACAVILSGLVFGAVAQSQDLGEEWTALSAADAEIIFRDPSLGDKVERHLRTTDDGYRYTFEIALWTGTLSRIPAAQVHYHKLLPGYFFRGMPDPKEITGAFTFFQDGDVEFAGLRNTASRLGQFKSRRFHFAGVECVSFVLQFGVSSSDRGSGETRRIYGFYCADPGVPLSDTRVDLVLGNIAIRSEGAP